MRLTAAAVRELALPTGVKERTYFDSELAGFGLRLRAGGSRVWVVQYKIGPKQRRMTLGSPASVDPSKARATAKDIIAAVRLGKDPAGDKQQARAKMAETFGAVLQRYLAHKRQQLRPGSYREVERHMLVHCKPLHPMPVTSINRRTVADLISELVESSGAAAADKTRASVRAFGQWLIRSGYIEANPADLIERPVTNGDRDRVLDLGELAVIRSALGSDQYSAIVELLMLTGCRREEIGGLRWCEVDLDQAVITLPPSRTKAGHEHKVPLAPAALAILRARPRTLPDGSAREHVFGVFDSGFQGWSTGKRDLDQRIAAARGTPLPGWRLHDLRRTLSTHLHDKLNVQPHIVEAVIGHYAGHKRGVAGVYNRANYHEQRREALTRWADFLAGLTRAVA